MIEQVIGNITPAIGVAIVVGLIRAVLGWAENALKDGVIDKFEWQQLVGTMAKYFSYVMILMVGLPLDTAVVTAFGLDVLQSAVKTRTTQRTNGNGV